jgi:glycosyltransferase involved in cell wall biosynthesis
MKIGMILDHEFPPDIRVENEANTLVESGFEVSILCYTHQKDKQGKDTYNNIDLYRFYRSKTWVKKGRALTNTPFDFYTPYWKKQIQKFIKTESIDILHVHDLYMLGAAYKANASTGIKVISDLHENYVDGLSNYQFANTFPGNILISQKKWYKTEKRWCKKADALITVIEEAVDRYSKLGVERKNIHVVANYVNMKKFLDPPDDNKILEQFKHRFTATYIGNFDLHRGLESVINALPRIIEKIPEFLLILVGSGKNTDALKMLASQLNVASYISFEGFQPETKLPSYIKASSVCLIPHLKTVHTDNTIPHKLFHYMLLEKPVISTDCNPIQRIIDETQSGKIYSSNNSEKLSDAIISLYNSKDKLPEMGKNGKNAVMEKYNWETAGTHLIKLYQQIESGTTK